MNQPSSSPTSHLTQPSVAALWHIAAPLSGAMLSQAVLGLVDTALVGNLGGLALASISIGSYLVFILVALLTGFGTGLHGLVSQHNQSHQDWLVTGLVLGLFMSVALGVLGAFSLNNIINLFVLDDRINSLAAHYSQWRLWSLPAIVISIVIRIYWSDRGIPWHYTKTVVLAHLLNVPISYGLIYGIAGLPAMGAVGAGVGTSIALWIGVFLQLNLLFQKKVKLTLNSPFFSVAKLLMVLRFIWPPMLQQLTFALHLAVFLWILSQLGASVMAASFSVLNVGLLLILPAIGLGQAALTLMGTSLANNDKVLAVSWGGLIIRCGSLIAIMLAIFVSITNHWLAQLLLVNAELQQLTATALPWYSAAMVLETGIIILSRFLFVAGLRKTTLLMMTAGQWLLFLPLLAWLAPSYGFMFVWWLHIAYRVLVWLLLWVVWQRVINQPQLASSIPK
ncbi:MAG: MATE family efflux transporter [Gammaproteobacteria bacterium]|nr:MATE family efflux transporter [Gammaproteobacteria bacterium]